MIILRIFLAVIAFFFLFAVFNAFYFFFYLLTTRSMMFPTRVAPEPALRHTYREPSRADTAQVFIATAYSPTGYLTKTETVPQVGRTIAVDPTVIPLGFNVWVDGREYVAEDTGKLVRGRHIDIFMANEREARNFGVQLVEVEVESCESR